MAEEFFQQGDLEQQELKATPMAMMDRRKKNELPQMQVGFIDSVCLPLYKVGWFGCYSQGASLCNEDCFRFFFVCVCFLFTMHIKKRLKNTFTRDDRTNLTQRNRS